MKTKKIQAAIPPSFQQEALLIIDVQKALFEKRIPIYQAKALLAKINRLVEQAHQAAIPVIYIQHSGKGDLARGADGWHLHPAIQPQPGDLLVHKQQGNAFIETELLDELNARQVGKLFICGLVTHGCVKATSQGALSHGYQLTLVSDAHSSYSEKAADLIAELNQKILEQGGTILPADQVKFFQG